MKFSDMMGKRDRDTEVTEPETTEPELPPEARTAPPVPAAPIRFGGNRSELDDAAAAFGGGTVAPPPRPVAPPVPAATAPPAPPLVAPEPPTAVQPSISDVVAELAPRPVAPAAAPAAAAVTDQQLDASAWLDGIGSNSIDDDLLPH